jgi:hypothetical protein
LQTTKESRKKKERAAFEAKLKQLASGYKSDQVKKKRKEQGRKSEKSVHYLFPPFSPFSSPSLPPAVYIQYLDECQ